MPSTIEAVTPIDASAAEVRAATAPGSYFAEFSVGSPAPWDRLTFSALGSLVAIWAGWFCATWAYWGNLSVDSGRELYVAWQLATGKTLYRDVWYTFDPGSPYFNSWLFRIFGVRLEVFYWAGSLAALVSAIFLFLIGMRFGSRLVGWTAAAILLSSAFHPSLFCFPLPYSFGAVYGCVVFIVFVWLVVCAAQSGDRMWLFGASWATGTALLLKPEFGLTCAITLGLLVAARALQRRSGKLLVMDLAACVPAALACSLVILWMISLKGFTFLTQENLQSWPTSYFMKNYGKLWLAFTGFAFTPEILAAAGLQLLILCAFLQGLHLVAHWNQFASRIRPFRIAMFLCALIYLAIYVPLADALRWLFFPPDLPVLLAALAVAAWISYLAQSAIARDPSFALLLTASALMTFRILFLTLPWLYPIYFSGPAILSFFLILRRFLRPAPPIPLRQESRRGEVLLSAVCAGALLVTLLNSRRSDTPTKTVVPLVTDRGTVKVTPSRAAQYRIAHAFMKQQAASGELVLSVPEDVSLYFLSGVECPVRIYLFTPGLLPPGKMTDNLINEIESKKIRYLIWSNRIFWEYGVPRFGVDFDKELGDYLFSHYRRMDALDAQSIRLGDWAAYIWERNPDEPPSSNLQSPLKP